jgi:hypothetical protein
MFRSSTSGTNSAASELECREPNVVACRVSEPDGVWPPEDWLEFAVVVIVTQG